MKCKNCQHIRTARRLFFLKTIFCYEYGYTIEDPDCECIYEERQREMRQRLQQAEAEEITEK